jgi:hypothetical protein
LLEMNTIPSPPQTLSVKFLRYFDIAAYDLAIVNNPPPTANTVMSTRMMINLIRAEEIAGAMVDGKALDRSGMCRKFEVESESGLGSRAFKRRNKERSVSEPVRPPR